MKTGNENTPLVALGVAIALVVSAIYVCWKPAVPYVLPGSKEARVTNRVQCNLAQKVKKINPYAAILVKELAWDPSLARAFMVELGGDRYTSIVSGLTIEKIYSTRASVTGSQTSASPNSQRTMYSMHIT
ncbi:hypothetical protein COS66_01995 [Candidatus Berkelbacteria bacterium CG06_land_8_20_14_3_00_43_10]|nr:MAG: hypothetical protein COS66_01995 [Candidatus Berkelbacteria bacterium CG06_land_8_20_14_3_00_43_10]